MRFLDQLMDRGFRRSKDGHRLFFPWGPLGRGYFVPFAEDEERIKRESSMLMAVLLPFGFLMIVFHRNLLVAGGLLAVVCIIGFFFGPLYLKRGLEPSTERLSFKEEFKAKSSRIPRWLVWCAVVFFYAYAIFCLVTLILAPQVWFAAGSLFLAFAFMGTVYLRILLTRRNTL